MAYTNVSFLSSISIRSRSYPRMAEREGKARFGLISHNIHSLLQPLAVFSEISR